MTTLAHEIALHLSNSAVLTSGLGSGGLNFVLLEHWPVPPAPAGAAPIPGQTPNAFDASRGNRLKRCIVVLDGGEVANPARQSFDRRRWDSFPTTTILSEAHDAGKQAAHDAYFQIESLLHGWEAIVSGQHIGFLSDNRLDLQESPDFAGNVQIVATWRAVSTRRLVAVA